MFFMASEEENNDRKTVVISEKTKERLDSVKVHPRETYEDVILRLLGGA